MAHHGRPGPPVVVYPTSQHYAPEMTRETPYMGEPHYGPQYGGLEMPVSDGFMGYDSMPHGGPYNGHMMHGEARAVSNYYSPSPVVTPVAPSCGPRKEFERVLLNPQSTVCNKPVTSQGSAACPPSTCDNSCTTAQFVLQPAANAY